MKRYIILILIFWSCQEDHSNPQQPTASAEILSIASDNQEMRGSVSFFQYPDRVKMSLELTGFSPGLTCAVHIHEGTCEEPGPHWNMGLGMDSTFCRTTSLGTDWGRPMAGDVGNVTIDGQGNGWMEVETDLWSLSGEKNIVGKVVFIHLYAEDFAEECLPDHPVDHPHDNPKIACGTIKFN